MFSGLLQEHQRKVAEYRAKVDKHRSEATQHANKLSDALVDTVNSGVAEVRGPQRKRQRRRRRWRGRRKRVCVSSVECCEGFWTPLTPPLMRLCLVLPFDFVTGLPDPEGGGAGGALAAVPSQQVQQANATVDSSDNNV